jgi:hypothetical protein
MAESNYKVNEAIEIVYQAPNKESGLTGVTAVIAEIYLPNDDKNSNFPDIELVEIGSEGIYNGHFTPDEQGEWKAIIHKSGGDGQVVKRYSVGAHNVSSVGDEVGVVDGKIVSLDTKVDANATTTDANVDAKIGALENVSKTEVNAEVDQALTDYDVSTKADEDAAHATTDGKIDALDIKVSSLDTPPMVS